ncbi:MAG: MAPEG family protein [Alphaproteobacteria bacterium]|nr:MAPEG family protein [Alphaproteobacteria bacterium]
MTAELYWLALTAVVTMFMGFPYVLERIARIGGVGAANYTKDGTAGFDQPSEAPSKWAARAYKAHRNALESLPIVGILVLIAYAAGVQNPNVLLGIQIYFFARLAHYLVYVMGVPLIRPIIFFIAWGGMALIAYTILT